MTQQSVPVCRLTPMNLCHIENNWFKSNPAVFLPYPATGKSTHQVKLQEAVQSVSFTWPCKAEHCCCYEHCQCKTDK